MEWMTSLMIVGGMLAIILIALGIRYISSPSDLDQKKVTKDVTPPPVMSSTQSSMPAPPPQELAPPSMSAPPAASSTQPSMSAPRPQESAPPSVVTVTSDHVDAPPSSTPKVKKKVKPKTESPLSAELILPVPAPLSERDIRINAVVKAYLDLIEANKASEIPALIRAKIGSLQSEDEAREAIALITAAQNNNNPLNGQREAIERIGVLIFFQRIRLREAMLGKVEEVIKELGGK